MKLQKSLKFTCDGCGKIEESEIDKKPTNWILIQETEASKVRLFEASRQKAYETFHIPNRIERTYCSEDCALVAFIRTLKMFLAEIRDIKEPKNHKPFTM